MSFDRVFGRFRMSPELAQADGRRISAAAFRVAVEQRLAALERDVAEVKSRVNGLIFVVVGAVITQVVVRLAEP